MSLQLPRGRGGGFSPAALPVPPQLQPLNQIGTLTLVLRMTLICHALGHLWPFHCLPGYNGQGHSTYHLFPFQDHLGKKPVSSHHFPAAQDLTLVPHSLQNGLKFPIRLQDPPLQPHPMAQPLSPLSSSPTHSKSSYPL